MPTRYRPVMTQSGLYGYQQSIVSQNVFLLPLTHWHLDKMTDILQMALYKEFIFMDTFISYFTEVYF